MAFNTRPTGPRRGGKRGKYRKTLRKVAAYIPRPAPEQRQNFRRIHVLAPNFPAVPLEKGFDGPYISLVLQGRHSRCKCPFPHLQNFERRWPQFLEDDFQVHQVGGFAAADLADGPNLPIQEVDGKPAEAFPQFGAFFIIGEVNPLQEAGHAFYFVRNSGNMARVLDLALHVPNRGPRTMQTEGHAFRGTVPAPKVGHGAARHVHPNGAFEAPAHFQEKFVQSFAFQ